MRQRRKKTRRRFDRVAISLTSMIDITFLLLLYFMITTIITEPEDRLRPQLQTKSDSASGSQLLDPQIVEVLNVNGTPIYRIGARTIQARQELGTVLGQLPKEQGLFVQVYDRVPVGFAVAALQEANDAGFSQVTYVPSE